MDETPDWMQALYFAQKGLFTGWVWYTPAECLSRPADICLFYAA
jgi:hypothetical protein